MNVVTLQTVLACTPGSCAYKDCCHDHCAPCIGESFLALNTKAKQHTVQMKKEAEIFKHVAGPVFPDCVFHNPVPKKHEGFIFKSTSIMETFSAYVELYSKTRSELITTKLAGAGPISLQL